MAQKVTTRADDIESDFDLYGATPTTAIVRPSPKPAAKPSAPDDIETDFDAFAKAPAAPAPKPSRGKMLDNAPSDDTGAALAKGTATGVLKGLSHIPGGVGDTAGLADYLIARAHSAVTGQPVEKVLADFAQRRAAVGEGATPIGKAANAIAPERLLPGSDFYQNKIFGLTGEYKPESGLGRAAMTGLETAVGAMAPGVAGAANAGNPIMAAVRSAPVTATMGAVGNTAAEATGDPLVGMAAGMAVPAALATARGAGRLATGTLPPERAQLAQTAMDQYGIPLGVGDLSGRLPVRFAKSVGENTPFSGGGRSAGEQQTAFNRAVSQTFGENAESITPQVMARARDRIGADFEYVARNTTIPGNDPVLMNDLMRAARQASLGAEGSQQQVARNIMEIADRFRRDGGAMNGRTFQDLTRRGDPASGRGPGLVQQLSRSQDPYVAEAGRAIQNALENALARHAPPEVQPILANARQQWRNMRTIEDLVAKAPTGDISPALLQGRVNAKSKGTTGRAYGGGGDLGELADIGKAFLQRPQSSGTSERLMVMGIPSVLSGAGAALAGGNPWHGVAGLAAIPASVVAGRTVNSMLSNPRLGENMILRSLGQPVPGPGNVMFGLPAPMIPPNGPPYLLEGR